MGEAKPFLQIVHISDLHIIAGGQGVGRRLRIVRRWLRAMRKALAGQGVASRWRQQALDRLKQIEDKLVDGTAPHDRRAPQLLRTFLETQTVNHPVWSHLPTVLVETGDLTTLGDAKSILGGRALVSDLGNVARAIAVLTVRGNHDEWPNDFPILAPEKIDQHCDDLRNLVSAWFDPVDPPLRVPFRDGAGEAQLFRMNTVLNGAVQNTFAFGELSVTAIDDLAAAIDNHATGRPTLRILLTHHPVRYPPPRPSHSMVLLNETQADQLLGAATPDGLTPLIHLQLSGHVHRIAPEHGTLQAHQNAAAWEQLTIGTLMQQDKFGQRGIWPHQCQFLRFYNVDGEPQRIRVLRRFAARHSGKAAGLGTGIGDYLFVPLADGSADEVFEIQV